MPGLRSLWMTVLLLVALAGAAGVAGAQDAWTAAANTLPTEMVWDQVQSVSVDAQNTGSTTWNSAYSLRSVQGATSAAFLVDRWGTTSVPVVGTVAPGATLNFAFGITAPPITTLVYPTPITPTTPPQVSSLANDWMLANTGALIRTDTAAANTTIERFPDMLPSTGENWAAAYVEELAGHVPVFVQGFPDNTYRPLVVVTRDQMAVFIMRALLGGDQNVPAGPANPRFTDVPTTYWAYKWIEAAVSNDIVQGFSDNTYRPIDPVTRDQMAVFVARGLAGGDANVPAGPTTAKFPDVPTTFWAYKYIEFAVANNVVTGFPSGNYEPTLQVTRDQMAVFIYRGFIQPTGAVVVLAGPAISRVEPVPPTPLYDGWSSLLFGTTAEAGIAYVGLDAERLLPSQAPIAVTFDLREEGSPSAAAVSTQTLDATTITNAKAAVNTTGGRPYFYVTADLDEATIPPGDYVLTVFIDGTQLARTVRITLR